MEFEYHTIFLKDGSQAAVVNAPDWIHNPYDGYVKAAEKILQSGYKHLVFDFYHTIFYGPHHSYYMACLITIADMYQQAGGCVSLVGLDSRTLIIYLGMGITCIFNLYKTQDDLICNHTIPESVLEEILRTNGLTEILDDVAEKRRENLDRMRS